MRARIGSTLSLARPVNGGSPQGSILGNLLCTVTTDKLTDNIEYNRGILNQAASFSSNHNTLDDLGQVAIIDPLLARVVGEQDSELGINNITVESSIENDHSLPFNLNGIDHESFENEPALDYYAHDKYVQSTPTARGQFEEFIPPGNLINACLDGDYSSITGLTFTYMQGRSKKAVIADSTDELLRSALMLSESNEELNNSAPVPPNWIARKNIVPFTYIDDSNGSERLNMSSGVVSYSQNKKEVSIHARDCQTFFTQIADRSSQIAMKINASKTQLLCISPAGDNCSAFVRIGNEKKESGKTLKICGYHFSNKPGVEEQIRIIEQKFNERAWLLRNLKRSGFTTSDLQIAYTSIVRPVFDFTAVVYHSLTTQEQKQKLERLQARALSIITGRFDGYRQALLDTNLCSLNERRLSLIDSFISLSLIHI